MTILKKIYWWAIWRKDGLSNQQISARFQIFAESEKYQLRKIN